MIVTESIGPGKCVILSAPSGAGKTTIVKRLLDQGHGLAFSVSATTRAPRPDELDGRDYHFLSEAEFRSRAVRGEFIEWEEVYPGRFYGTLKSEVERIWVGGRHVVFDIDVIGGLRLKEIFKDKALAIFVSPPSLAVLEKRLRARGTESDETLATRVEKARQEMTFAPRFDLTLVNDDLETACEQAFERVTQFLA